MKQVAERFTGLCKKKKIHPFEALLKLCTHADPAIQLGAVKEACSYLYPKRKAIELSEDRENPLGASSEAEALEKMREQVRILREERFGK